MLKRRMKKGRRVVAALCVAGLAATACGSDEPGTSGGTDDITPATDASTDSTNGTDAVDGVDPLKVVLVINGNLGDRSFFDSAQQGIDLAASELGADVRTVELGSDPAAWEPGLADVAADEESYDVLITSTFNMAEPLQSVAPEHPDKNFIIFDVAVDYESGCCDNVYSIVYKQNEAAYLGGLYASLMTTQTDLDGINEELTLGFVGGIDIPVINDFAVGFKQGATDGAGANVLEQYAGEFSDPARGKEIALSLYNQGADIVFHAAGGTGAGVFEAAAETGKWSMGVDSDQAAALAEGAPEEAGTILTSVLKKVDQSLLRAIDLHIAGELPYGSLEALGLAEDAVGLARNDQFSELTPPEVVTAIDEATASITSGDIVVDTAFG